MTHSSYSPIALALAIACAPAANAATTVLTDNTLTAIPDGSSAGVARVLSLSGTMETIDSLELSLHIAAVPGEAAFLGDLYAYLTNGTDLAILVNRPGRTSTAPSGYADNQSFNVTFSNGGLNDIHTYRVPTTGSVNTPLNSTLIGTWLADGRFSDPASVLDTDIPTARLDVFDGKPADNDWVLFVADLSSGGAHQLVSWSITLNTVPEASTLLLSFLTLPLLLRRNR